MADTTTPAQTMLVEMTSEMVAAYVAQNHVQPSEMPALIASVHAALSSLNRPQEVAPEPEKQKPAVPIKKSITDEFIISLEDGRKFKSMKRYLGLLGMTPADYRAKWGLPPDYPMVAPAYAAQRATLAKTFGLGSMRNRHGQAVEAALEPEVRAEPDPASEKRKAGRPKVGAA
jgi:predicted transcriptional regulator